jgi:3-methyladenine DNA glycosylase Tag
VQSRKDYRAIYGLMLKKLKEVANGSKLDESLRQRAETDFDKATSNMSPLEKDSYLFGKLVACMFVGRFSAITVDKKITAMRKAFYNFDTSKIADMDERQIQEIIWNPDVIRHPGKIRAVVENAREIQSLKKEYGTFADFIKSFENDADKLAPVLQDRFKWLGPATSLDFVKDIGIDAVKPDVHVIRILGRLGLISGTESTPVTRREVGEVVKMMSEELGIKMALIDGVIWFYGADRKGHETTKAICGSKPLCGECYLQEYCDYYKRQKKEIIQKSTG